MDNLLREIGYRPETESFEEFASRIRIEKQDAEREAKKCEETLIPIALHSLGFDELEFPLVQAALLRRRIASGEINPIIGRTLSLWFVSPRAESNNGLCSE